MQAICLGEKMQSWPANTVRWPARCRLTKIRTYPPHLLNQSAFTCTETHRKQPNRLNARNSFDVVVRAAGRGLVTVVVHAVANGAPRRSTRNHVQHTSTHINKSWSTFPKSM